MLHISHATGMLSAKYAINRWSKVTNGAIFILFQIEIYYWVAGPFPDSDVGGLPSNGSGERA